MKKLALIILATVFYHSSPAQSVGIGTTAPDNSAMLDVQSTTKGVLLPRLTTAQRTSIASPASGLLVFDINTSSFWFKNSAGWTELVDTSTNTVKRNGTNTYLNTTGNLGIGTTTPVYDVHISRNDPSIGFYDENDSHSSGNITGDSTDLLIAAYRKSSVGSNEPGDLLLQTNTGGFPSFVAGKVGIGTKPDVKLHVSGGTDITSTSGGYLQLGNTSSTNMAFDNNEIQARSNGSAVKLTLQNEGGGLQVGNGTGTINFTSSGEMNRDNITGASNLVPLAYGRISQGGTIVGSTGNFSVQKPTTGTYKITLINETNVYQNRSNYVILATPYNTLSLNVDAYFINAGIASDNTIEVRIAKPKTYFVNSSCSQDCGPFSYIQNLKFFDEIDNEFSILIYKY